MSERSYTPEQSEAILLAAAEYHAAVAALRSITGTGTAWQTAAGRVAIFQARLLAVARDPETTPAWGSETMTTPHPSKWIEAARRIRAGESETDQRNGI